VPNSPNQPPAVRTLADLSRGRDNNLNLIRFVAASMVLFSHSYHLAGQGSEGDPFRLVSLGAIAVEAFFVLSGFLVTGSLLLRNSLMAYARARCLRIFPALILVTFLAAFVLGPSLTTLSWSDYLTSPQLFRFLATNSSVVLGVSYQLPGVFADNPYGPAVNGSLWSLPWEVRMYLALGFGFLLFRRQFRLLITTAALLLIVAFGLNSTFQLTSNYWAVIGLRLGSLFFLGSAAWFFREKIVLNGRWCLLAVGFFGLTAWWAPRLLPAVQVLVLTYCLFYLAYVPAGLVRGFNRLGDYSYGVYIYAFPAQQTIMSQLPETGPLHLSLLAFAITLPFAAFSWHLVEKPALQLKDRFAARPKLDARPAINPAGSI